MDSTDQMTRAQALDPVQSARVVRGIADIEQDYIFAAGALSDRFMREAAVAVRKAAPDTWEVEGTETELSLSAPGWKTRGFHDAWLELAEIADDEEDHSWIAAAVGTAHTKMCLELAFRPALQGSWDRVRRDAATVAPLLKAGFQQCADSGQLFLPVAINADALAKGFELNDLDKAMAPLRSATEKAVAAKPALDALLTLLRGGKAK